MRFYSAICERPVRLCGETRRFADESLHHRYGLDTKMCRAVTLDDIDGYESLTPLERYDSAIARIAEASPIRICDGERISGAATLGMAMEHMVPATYGGKSVCESVSHLTLDFGSVLRRGIRGIGEDAAAALERYRGTEREEFAESCVHTVNSFCTWHKRYLDALSERPELKENYDNLSRVPLEPARNFYEAVQSLWFTFAFCRLCGNWPGIGRIDCLLGDYLKRDLADGILTLDEAREILAHFFIKGCEWISGKAKDASGDAQHYQNIVLSGTDADGRDVTCEVTYLVLDIIEELGIGDFPTTVRLGKNSSERLLRRVAEVIRYGGGVVAVYDEDSIIKSLTDYGYAPEAAARFANDGCWEIQVPGETYFSYCPFDAMRILQETTLHGYDGTVSFDTFEKLYQQYVSDLNGMIDTIVGWHSERFLPHAAGEDVRWAPWRPCTVVSIFERGCIERGQSYFEGGPIYNIVSPHIGGLPDTVDSLLAIRHLVYEEKRLTLPEFMHILKNDWADEEPLRRYVRTHYSYYGTDCDTADELACRLVEDFADACDRQAGKCPYRFPAGISTFGRQIEWAGYRLATPHGYHAGAILSGNCSPTPGTDTDGATATIRSYCKLNLKRMVSGAALDIKLDPTSVKGEDGLSALVALMRGFCALGGSFMQLDVADVAALRAAQEHPEDYETLSVRISGWNARFVTLGREWQNMVIEQTERHNAD